MDGMLSQEEINALLSGMDTTAAESAYEAEALSDMEKDIIVVPANEENMDVLVSMSYEQPFMRVIIDDYTINVTAKKSAYCFVTGGVWCN